MAARAVAFAEEYQRAFFFQGVHSVLLAVQPTLKWGLVGQQGTLIGGDGQARGNAVVTLALCHIRKGRVEHGRVGRQIRHIGSILQLTVYRKAGDGLRLQTVKAKAVHFLWRAGCPSVIGANIDAPRPKLAIPQHSDLVGCVQRSRAADRLHVDVQFIVVLPAASPLSIEAEACSAFSYALMSPSLKPGGGKVAGGARIRPHTFCFLGISRYARLVVKQAAKRYLFRCQPIVRVLWYTVEIITFGEAEVIQVFVGRQILQQSFHFLVCINLHDLRVSRVILARSQQQHPACQQPNNVTLVHM